MWGVSTYTFGFSHSSNGYLKQNLTLSLTFRVNKEVSWDGSIFSVCGPNPMVWPFQRKRFGSTLIWLFWTVCSIFSSFYIFNDKGNSSHQKLQCETFWAFGREILRNYFYIRRTFSETTEIVMLFQYSELLF